MSIGEQERRQDQCGVTRGSIGIVGTGYVLPLLSGGPNVVGRRVGANKSEGEQGMCLFI